MLEIKNPHANGAGAQSVAGHNAEPSTARNQGNPPVSLPHCLDDVIKLQGWLEQAASIIDLACRDIDGKGPGPCALGAAQGIVNRAMNRLEVVEGAMMQAGIRPSWIAKDFEVPHV
jgi:hypothetical protein